MKNEKSILTPFYPHTKAGACVIGLLLLVPIVFFCVFGFMDKDKAVSEDENRALAQLPRFSVEKLFDGKLTADFDKYYSDQFLLREFFLSINMKTKKVLTQYGGKNNIVLFEGSSDNDFKGEEAKNGK